MQNISESTLRMLQAMIPLGAGLLLLAVVILLYMRGRGIRRLAASMGMKFSGRAPYDLGETGLDVLTSGTDRALKNQLSGLGAAGAAARFFDLEFSSGYGRNKRTESLTVALFEFPKQLFPAFALRKEGLFDKLAAGLGWEDIDIRGAEGFSGRYYLSGKDKGAIQAFWTPRRLSAFELPARAMLEANGRYLAFYRRSASVSAGNYPKFIEEATSAAAALAGRA